MRVSHRGSREGERWRGSQRAGTRGGRLMLTRRQPSRRERRPPPMQFLGDPNAATGSSFRMPSLLPGPTARRTAPMASRAQAWTSASRGSRKLRERASAVAAPAGYAYATNRIAFACRGLVGNAPAPARQPAAREPRDTHLALRPAGSMHARARLARPARLRGHTVVGRCKPHVAVFVFSCTYVMSVTVS